MSPAIIILTGPPGSGKTTIGELLSKNAPRNSVHVRADSFYDWIRSGFIPPGDPASHAQNTAVLTAIADAALAYWRGGYEVIIDGIIGPWFLPLLQQAFARAGAPAHYVIARAPEQIAIDRCLARDRVESEEKMSTIRALHAAFANSSQYEPNVIDTGSRTPEAAASLIRRQLSQGAFRLT